MKKRRSSQKSQKPTVKNKGTKERVTIGMDLEDKTSRYCVLSHEGDALPGQLHSQSACLLPWTIQPTAQHRNPGQRGW